MRARASTRSRLHWDTGWWARKGTHLTSSTEARSDTDGDDADGDHAEGDDADDAEGDAEDDDAEGDGADDAEGDAEDDDAEGDDAEGDADAGTWHV